MRLVLAPALFLAGALTIHAAGEKNSAIAAAIISLVNI